MGMKRFSKSRFLIWFILALSMLNSCSCASKAHKVDDFKKASNIKGIMESWVGHYQSELVASWGPPTKIISDEKGGTIIVYESLKGTWGDQKDKRIVGGSHYPTTPRQPGYVATRIFYVNEKGIIYSWKWSGL
jgi:hypothetical protein